MPAAAAGGRALRFKPAGRSPPDLWVPCAAPTRAAPPAAADRAATPRRHRVRVQGLLVHAGMLTHHKPAAGALSFLAVYGCAGGDLLVAAGRRSAGRVQLRAPPVNTATTALREYFQSAAAFPCFAKLAGGAGACRSCSYYLALLPRRLPSRLGPT